MSGHLTLEAKLIFFYQIFMPQMWCRLVDQRIRFRETHFFSLVVILKVMMKSNLACQTCQLK